MAKQVIKRSAVTGEFVTRDEAKKNPDTTVRESRIRWRKLIADKAEAWEERARESRDPAVLDTLQGCAAELRALLDVR